MNPLAGLDIQKLSQEEKRDVVEQIVRSPKTFPLLTDKFFDEIGFESDILNAKAETLRDHIRTQAAEQSQQRRGTNS